MNRPTLEEAVQLALESVIPSRPQSLYSTCRQIFAIYDPALANEAPNAVEASVVVGDIIIAQAVNIPLQTQQFSEAIRAMDTGRATPAIADTLGTLVLACVGVFKTFSGLDGETPVPKLLVPLAGAAVGVAAAYRGYSPEEAVQIAIATAATFRQQQISKN